MNLANKLTIFRIILVPVFIDLILKYHQMPQGTGEEFRVGAILVFIVAVLTDAADGYIARRHNQQTRLGTYLDPIADKLLLMSAVILFSLPIERFTRLPLWVTVSVISRDVIIVIGSLVIYVVTGKLKVLPSILGKATTFFQMMAIVSILFMLPHPEYVWRVAG
ncbi:MAG TPA: CDP-alcohol phosphatidyltransferase family protein, partial [bacterium]|nr:CDP-alcohol phosphatidyltransferase family protein [bacterium]